MSSQNGMTAYGSSYMPPYQPPYYGSYQNCYPGYPNYPGYPTRPYVPPNFKAAYDQYVRNAQTQYNLSQELNHYKSSLYVHEEGTRGTNTWMPVGAVIGGGLGLLGFFGGPILGGITLAAGLLGGGFLGNLFGGKDAKSGAIINDAQDGYLNGSPMGSHYTVPAMDPYYAQMMGIPSGQAIGGH